MTSWWPWVRLVTALLGIAALARQLVLAIGNALVAETPAAGHLPTIVVNFFSYFTVLSNLIAAATLIAGAVWALRHRRDDRHEPLWLAALFACAATYMIVTGIVYNVLLRSIQIAGISDAWTNEMLHVVVPIVMLADAIFAPRRTPLPWRTVPLTAIFPLVWAIYTLSRANLVTAPSTGTPWWYPYPFLDPHQEGGFAAVAGYIVGIAAVILVVASFVVWAGRRRARSAPAPVPDPESAEQSEDAETAVAESTEEPEEAEEASG